MKRAESTNSHTSPTRNRWIEPVADSKLGLGKGFARTEITHLRLHPPRIQAPEFIIGALWEPQSINDK